MVSLFLIHKQIRWHLSFIELLFFIFIVVGRDVNCCVCTGGETAPTDICPHGYYCPNGTKLATEFACPNGTYNDIEGIRSEDECKNCTQGKYYCS